MPREAPDRFRTQILVARGTEPNYLADLDLTLVVNRTLPQSMQIEIGETVTLSFVNRSVSASSVIPEHEPSSGWLTSGGRSCVKRHHGPLPSDHVYPKVSSNLGVAGEKLQSGYFISSERDSECTFSYVLLAISSDGYRARGIFRALGPCSHVHWHSSAMISYEQNQIASMATTLLGLRVLIAAQSPA
jgi:hypothetical protein